VSGIRPAGCSCVLVMANSGATLFHLEKTQGFQPLRPGLRHGNDERLLVEQRTAPLVNEFRCLHENRCESRFDQSEVEGGCSE